ncbi:MAG: MiaB/RimO family radical SAM methylthiotransferase [Proteobacteria bacterium]|nr:MiaB/RimO family radical SAM methylthiotransferase [Pseudomonadota bacterium]
MTRRIHLSTLGCRLNEAELQRWSWTLLAEGWTVLEQARGAEVVVLNTCAVTDEAARKSRQAVKRLRQQCPDAALVLTGCLATIDPTALGELPADTLRVGNAEKDRLPELLRQRWPWAPTAPDPAHASAPSFATRPRRQRTRAFVKVQDGCRHRCAFCVVTLARGSERSLSAAAVVAEVAALAEAGWQEAVLTGVHLGGWSEAPGRRLDALVRAVLEGTRLPRLRLSSLEPWALPAPLWALWQDPRLCPHLHLPLQSGSDRLLRRMARRGDRASYRRLIDAARRAIPGLVFSTDLLVGFPGESDEDFAQTLALCDQLAPTYLHVFPFSPRPRTAAAGFSEHVPTTVVDERCAQLRALGQALLRTELARWVGSTRPVLWEGSGEPVEGGALRRWWGLTDNYLRVTSTTAATVVLGNRIVPTRLIASDQAQLIGVPTLP